MRNPQLADLIDSLAARCPAAGPTARDKPGFHREWMRAAKQPTPQLIGALAAAVGSRLPVRKTSILERNYDLKRHAAWIDRVAALAALDDDPRISAALVEIVRRAPFSESERLYQPALALIERIGDARAIASLRELAAHPVAKWSTIRTAFESALPATADAIAARPPGALDRTLAALVGQLVAAPSKPAARRHVATLIADCLNTPDDDGPREVLADALIEQNQPWGELIMLQLRAARGAPTDDKRAASIQRAHEKAWLGELARVTKNRVYQRGFLDQAELHQNSAADAACWERCASDRMLATVRVLHKGKANETLYRSFVMSPVMRSLRTIEVPTTRFLGDLAALDRPVDEVVLESGLTKDALAILDRMAPRVGLGRLAFATRESCDAVIGKLSKWSGRAQLSGLWVTPVTPDVRPWSAWLTAHAALAPIKRIGVRFSLLEVTAEQGRRGLIVDACGEHEWGLIELLGGQLHIERLIVRGSARSASHDRLPRALAQLPKTTVVELRDGWLRRPRAGAQ